MAEPKADRREAYGIEPINYGNNVAVPVVHTAAKPKTRRKRNR